MHDGANQPPREQDGQEGCHNGHGHSGFKNCSDFAIKQLIASIIFSSQGLRDDFAVLVDII